MASALQTTRSARGSSRDRVHGISLSTVREPVSKRAYSVVRLETGSGIVGYGECAPIERSELNAAAEAVLEQPPTAIEPVRARLAAHPQVCAAVNMAMLDIVGQMAGAPVYQLLGGPTRHKVRALAALERGEEDELGRARASGFHAFAVPVGPVAARNQGQAFVHSVKQRLEERRRAAGAGTDFVLDGAGSLTPGDAAGLAAALERFHLLWFDEPCALANLAAARKISEECVTPLGYGRSIHRAGEFQDLLRESMVDVVRPDLGRHGVTGIRRIAAIAETYYVAVAPYHDGGPIATAAALHLAASLPNFFIQQIPWPADQKDREMRAELTSGSIEVVRDGYVPLLTGPGLGIRVNEEAIKKYAEA